ncbi:MAG: M14 family metallopeptidase [Gemmatimonadota bacterium]|nr:M14 family metallopeptidase [Gemmatimonadota bacterium]
MYRHVSVLIVICVPCVSQTSAQEMDLSSLQTRAELSDFAETTRYEEVMSFLDAVALASELIHFTTFGYTTEGRELPLLVFGDVWDGSPEEVGRSGKTRVFIQANIHAGEVCGKEALLMLARDLADGEHTGWADSLVVLIAPVYNADGNERISLYNRGRQHGPAAGMGQRPNAQGYDLNRDHMKLDSPEARSLVRMMRDYDPHVMVDLHTTNGTIHAYHLTYSPPLNPNTAAPIVDYLRRNWLPSVTESVKNLYGWDYYYYGNLPFQSGSRERGWYTFDHRPRFNNNYIGLRNRFAILSEAYSYATFEDRILASLYFVEEILDFAHDHAEEIRNIVDKADLTSVVGQQLAVRSEHTRSAEEVEILLGSTEEERNPYTGRVMLRRTEERKPERMFEFGRFNATETVTAPATYFVPASLTDVIERLEAHGVWFEPLTEARTMTLERFRIDSTTVAERPFQGHNECTLYGAYETVSETLAAGTLVVPVDQSLGRLVFYLLEPRSDDGLVNWNILGDTVKEAAYFPILREPAK